MFRNILKFLKKKEKEEPTAMKANDRLSLVLSYQRTEINENKIKDFQCRLIKLCDEFGYDVVGQVKIVPQAKKRSTIINATIPIKLKEKA